MLEIFPRKTGNNKAKKLDCVNFILYGNTLQKEKQKNERLGEKFQCI